MSKLLIAVITFGAVLGCQQAADPTGCPPAGEPGALTLGEELEGMCSARGVTPVLDRCERTGMATVAGECTTVEALLCQGEGENTFEVTVTLDGEVGTADVTALAPTLESLGTARVLCWSRYLVARQ